MNAHDLGFLYGINQAALRRNTEGLTHEESVRPPEPAGNCLNWVLGHIVATRHAALRMLQLEGPWPPDTVDLYKRGSAPLTDAALALRWERLLEDFDHTQALLQDGLDRATDAALAAPGGRSPVGELDVGRYLAFLQFHEAYHIGQIGVLRRLAGREGAIR